MIERQCRAVLVGESVDVGATAKLIAGDAAGVSVKAGRATFKAPGRFTFHVPNPPDGLDLALVACEPAVFAKLYVRPENRLVGHSHTAHRMRILTAIARERPGFDGTLATLPDDLGNFGNGTRRPHWQIPIHGTDE